jgi:hypothetical protein
MLKSVFAVITTIFLTGVLAADEHGPSKEIPELAPLSNWAGDWIGHVEKPMPRPPGPSKGVWILDGRFLQQTWKIPADADNPALSATVISTWDVNEKVYRQWQFLSDGATGQATGKWDAASNTMIWTERKPDGLTIVTRARFPNSDLQLWTITGTDRAGTTVFELSGDSKRQKK